MRVDAFDFELPEDRIALRPVRPRDAARMLVVRPGAVAEYEDRHVADLLDLLRPGDVLVFNDTKVIPAKLTGTRTRKDGSVATIHVNLHKRISRATWAAFARPAKRLRIGDEIVFGKGKNACVLGALDATVRGIGEGGEVTLAFDLAGSDLDGAIAARGAMPLPPYIASKREADLDDLDDYQTVFASAAGAVAAPTAGLHFTRDLLAKLADKGIAERFVTLHVGAGTFLPVKTDDTGGHKMHTEWGEVDEATAAFLNQVHENGGRIVAVGTTSLRLLESAAGPDGVVRPFKGETDIFITPGYQFRAVDVLMTNFHLPRSTLFMLVSAFSGLETMQRAYAHAIAGGYRFYSYGDASLLYRVEPA